MFSYYYFFLLTDWTSFEHTWEPWIHSRNHVRIIQRPWSVYRCSGRACPGCVVDVTSGWREDPHRNRHRLRRRGHSRHSCCKFSVTNVVLLIDNHRNVVNQCYIWYRRGLIGMIVFHFHFLILIIVQNTVNQCYIW